MGTVSRREPEERELDLLRREAMAFASIGLYRFTFDGEILFMDEGAFKIFGLEDRFAKSDDVAGLKFSTLIEYVGPEGLMRKQMRSNKRIRAREWTFRTLSGEEKWVVEDSYLVTDNSSKKEAIQVIIRDITEQRHIQTSLKEREEQLHRILDSTVDPLHIVDANLKIVMLNRAFRDFAESVGVNVDGVEKDLFSVFTFLPEKIREEYQQALNTGEVVTTVERIPLSGHEIITETRKIPVIEHGKVTAIITIVRDLTAYMKTERALLESEEKHRAILDNIQEGYYEVDLNGNCTFFNKALCRILGYEESEILGLNFRTYYPEDAQKHVINTFRAIYNSGEPAELQDWEIIRKDGGTAVLGVSVSLMRDAFGKPIGFRGIAHDITRRKEAENALRKAEERNRALLDAIPDAMLRLRKDGTVLAFKLGYGGEGVVPPPEKVIGTKLWEHVSRDLGNRFMSMVCGVIDSHTIHTLEFEMPLREEILDYEARAVASGADEALVLIRNMSERKRSERALRESEERYRDLFENANDIVYTLDPSGSFTSLNNAGILLFGYTLEEALKLNAFEVIVPEHRHLSRTIALRRLRGEPTASYELEAFAKDGHRIPLEVSTRTVYRDGKAVGVQGIARDITERRRAENERKRLEAQIQHAQKLEGLGVLAGGIAHDFNNLLVGILGYAGLALTKIPQNSPARSYLERIEQSAQRAAELTNQMLAYSGKGSFVVRPINLFALVEDVTRLLSASISKKAALRFHCDSDIPEIIGDPTQIHQVIMNLITNASDALGDNPGDISLSVTNVAVDRMYLAKSYLDDALPEGRYVCLEISDTGCGMDKETLAKIFDPFFSTKFTGRGLGLAAVLGIVRSHKGAVRVYSEPGQGTTFKVLFPIEACQAEVSSVAVSEVENLSGWRGSGVVLIADDEQVARDVAGDVLKDRGFDVATASNGLEAVEVFKERVNEIQAVILDLTMPVMSGQEAFEQMAIINPNVPVILSSGYTEQDATLRFASRRPAAFIQKPYALPELLRKLHGVIGK
jgi:PAS domain S-box-containing protein